MQLLSVSGITGIISWRWKLKAYANGKMMQLSNEALHYKANGGIAVAAAYVTAAANIALKQHKRIEEEAAAAYLKKSSSKAFSTRTDRSDRTGRKSCWSGRTEG